MYEVSYSIFNARYNTLPGITHNLRLREQIGEHRSFDVCTYIFSERELFAVARPSVVCLSSVVCNARAPIVQAVEILGN